MKPQSRSVAPIYYHNYAPGYIGFCYPNEPGIISSGISYFTRFDRMSDIKVSHCFIVTDRHYCIEAHLNTGVARAPLSQYFGHKYQVFFRRPQGLTRPDEKLITGEACSLIGKQYDRRLIAAHLLSGSLLGRIANKLLFGLPEIILADTMDNPGAYICSELCAACLRASPRYVKAGCLAKGPASISPQELFEDDEVFEPWHCEEEE